ncbi:MAG TPA: hypothetical protein VMT18_07630 [Planctomycetota bacterium]|nr:hypothetical protein [Planctomycetota bacterium]
MTRALFGATLGGLIGAALWAGVAFLFHYEIGWIAWGIGVACGFGAAKFGDQLDWSTGAAAAGIAVLSIALGKYAAVQLVVDDAVAEIASGQVEIDEELAVSYVADEVVAAFHAEQRPVNWPGGVEPSNPTMQSEYPRDVWAEAQRAWNELTPQERATFKADLARDLQANAELFRDGAVQAGFRESFGALDVLFLFLAVGSAYKLGSGAQANA